MKKFLLLFLLALFTGAVSSYADEVSFDFNTMGSTGWTSSYANHVATGDGYKVTFSAASKQTSTITDVPVTKAGTVTFEMTNDKTLKNVTFNLKQWSNKTQTAKISYKTSGSNSYTLIKQNISVGTVLKVETGDLVADVVAVQLEFTNSSNQIGVASLEYTVNDVVEDSRKTVKLEWSSETATAILGEDFDAPTLTVNPEEALSAVTYSSSNADVASFDNGKLSINGAGSATITAEITENDNFKATSASYNLIVIDPNSTSYQVTFKNNSDNGTSNLTSTTFPSEVVTGSSFISFKECSNVYSGTNGLKYGSSSNAGTLTLNFVDPSKIKSITVNTAKYSSESNTIKVTLDKGLSTQVEFEAKAVGTEFTLDVNSETKFQTITFAGVTASKSRFYLCGFSIETASEAGGEEPEPEPETIADPVLSIANGSTVTVGDKLVITCETEGAEIVGMIGETDLEGYFPYTYTFTDADATAGTVDVMVSANKGDLESNTIEATYNVKAASIEPEQPTNGTTYALVTSADDLEIGGSYIIVAAGYDKAMSTTQNSNNRGAVDITKDEDNNTITITDEAVEVITFEDSNNAEYPYLLKVNDGYLFAGSNSSNHLKTQQTADSYSQLKVTFKDNKTYLQFNRTSGDRYTIEYNSANNNGNIFSCYKEDSQSAVVLYRSLDSVEEPVEKFEAPVFYVNGTAVEGTEYTYNEGDKISIELDDLMIIYTTDGSDLDVDDSELFVDPITFEKYGVYTIKAAATDGETIGNVATLTVNYPDPNYQTGKFTFDFTTGEGVYGLVTKSNEKGNNDYQKVPYNFNDSTKFVHIDLEGRCRHFKDDKGYLDLRFFKSTVDEKAGQMTISVPDGYAIKTIKFNGGDFGTKATALWGTLNADVWTSESASNSITFVNNTDATIKVNAIDVEWETGTVEYPTADGATIKVGDVEQQDEDFTYTFSYQDKGAYPTVTFSHNEDVDVYATNVAKKVKAETEPENAPARAAEATADETLYYRGVEYVKVEKDGEYTPANFVAEDGNKAGAEVTYFYSTAGKASPVHTITFSETTGVENVDVDTVAGEAEYYTIGGVKVSADQMVPGLYIKRVGTTATKVMVR
ncbi:MAG: hypothetical protein J1E63_03225 [Muribaculaceae bacterium]|nr:hypothetical protein [Muribaculaceae bacterium]